MTGGRIWKAIKVLSEHLIEEAEKTDKEKRKEKRKKGSKEKRNNRGMRGKRIRGRQNKKQNDRKPISKSNHFLNFVLEHLYGLCPPRQGW